VANLRAPVATTDGGFVIVGNVTPAGQTDSSYYLSKTNASMVAEFERQYGRPDDVFVNSVLQTFDAGFLIGGTTLIDGIQDTEIFIVKTDAMGNVDVP